MWCRWCLDWTPSIKTPSISFNQVVHVGSLDLFAATSLAQLQFPVLQDVLAVVQCLRPGTPEAEAVGTLWAPSHWPTCRSPSPQHRGRSGQARCPGPSAERLCTDTPTGRQSECISVALRRRRPERHKDPSCLFARNDALFRRNRAVRL